MDSISKSTQNLTTAEDMRNQTKLTMQPYANWENYLTPAPLSIAILGELVFISSSTDFSINKNPPKDGYKFIKYPDSFRACLMQVCHSGWWAFNEAHTNMDQIRLHTAQVPDYMKRAVKILFQDDDEIVNAHLPDQLGNIQVIAEECLQLSNATSEQFKNVLSIIQELLEACTNAKLIYGEEREDIKKKLEENELKKKSAEQVKKNTEKAVSRLEKELDEADEKYKKALDSLPTGWNMIAMDVVGGLMQGITGLITGLTYVVTNPVNQMCSVTTKIADTMSHIKSQECMNVVDEINLYSKSNEILCSVNIIKEKMEVSDLDDDIKWNNLYDQKEKYTKTDFIKQQFKRIKSDLQKIPDCRPKTQAQSLCKKGIEICEQLAKYAPSGKCDKVKSSEIIDEVLNLIKSAQIFDSKSKDITKSPAISPNPPMLNKQESMLENPGQRVIENTRFVIEQTRTQLNQTKDEHGKCVENLKISENELNDILVTLRNCTLQEIDFNTTIQMLSKGMKAMGKVEEQWQKMVNFFQIVSNIVKISLNKTLTNFGSTAKTTQVLSYNQKLFSKDLLYIQAFQASNIASFVHMISGTYTDVSNKYLMNPVGSLSKLMAMDISDPEFKRERKQFENSCDEAQRGISKLVLKNKEEFERNSTARLERIDKELLAILPAAPPEQIKSIQEAVQAGFTEEAAASYY